jgi:anti-sigma regulatory factor (Ser/Thr protein kinase)
MADRSADSGRRALAAHASRVSLVLPPTTASVPEARHFVDRALPETCWAAEVTLLVSELASNAVRHAVTPFTVSLQCDGSTVRVEVRDDDPALPVMQEPPVDAITGRGLVIVDALATRWGVTPEADGKIVWFELACRSPLDDASA